MFGSSSDMCFFLLENKKVLISYAAVTIATPKVAPAKEMAGEGGGFNWKQGFFFSTGRGVGGWFLVLKSQCPIALFCWHGKSAEKTARFMFCFCVLHG